MRSNIFKILVTAFVQTFMFISVASSFPTAAGFKYDKLTKNNFPPLGKVGVYNYAPSIIKDGSTYKAWWCGGPTDQIYYSTATSLSGPWTAPEVVFTPSGKLEVTFDGAMTCDPSVIKINGVYYMYYTGYPSFKNQLDGGATNITKIGVASSTNGRNWTRLNGGLPIISPFQTTTDPGRFYGAGHPSITYAKGKFYLAYSDSTGASHEHKGQYVLRSADPMFKTGVEERRSTGWVKLATNGKPNTSFSPITHAVNVDWAYVPALDKFAVSINGILNVLSVRFYSFNLAPTATEEQHMEGVWNEGPGLVTNADGTLTVSSNLLTLSLARSVGCHSVRESWRIAFSEMRLNTTIRANQTTVVKQPTSYDLDGNGISDRIVWRPSNGTWYARLDSGHSCVIQHGKSGDIPLIGKFKHAVNGVERNPYGHNVMTVYRPSNGNWYLFTPPFIDSVVQWGLPGDIPVPGDYNNDGTTDLAVWRPSNGTWYLRNIKTEQWGLPGDIPVPVSDDTDQAKIAVWRPSNGTWYFKASGVGYQFGLKEDVPIARPGILVGGTHHEYAVFRPSIGSWIYQTSPQHTVIQYGLPGDVPVVGDFDGNGHNDIAVWRPSNGTWYTSGKPTVQWGLPGDIPVNISPSVHRLKYR